MFDHFQAMVAALCAKISSGENRSAASDFTGGATFSLDLWPGHPLDEHNKGSQEEATERLVVYVGQHFRTDRTLSE